jgi:hypothetical protein
LRTGYFLALSKKEYFRAKRVSSEMAQNTGYWGLLRTASRYVDVILG